MGAIIIACYIGISVIMILFAKLTESEVLMSMGATMILALAMIADIAM